MSAHTRPSVFLGPEEISRLRLLLKAPGWRSALYRSEDSVPRAWPGGDGVLANARYWLAREVEVPERGGHYHHFFCEDGSRLEWPEDRKPHPEGYPCPSCGKVYSGERYDGAVRWGQHNELAVAALDLGLAYHFEEAPEFAAKCARILLAYAHAYPGPHTSASEGGIMLQALCESVWSISISGAYDLVYDTLKPEERVVIEGRLLKPMAAGLQGVGHMEGNHGSWHLAAVGLAGFATRDQSLVDWARERFEWQMNNLLGSDGLWPESVHTYHFYPLNAFIYFAEAARRNGLDLYAWEGSEGRSLRAMFRSPLYYMYPDFSLAAINNGWYGQKLPVQMYELAWARWKDPEFAWAVSEGWKVLGKERSGIWALLYGEELPEEIHPPKLASTNFHNIGIAVLRGADSMLTFDYGRLLIHGQSDKMGVTLFARGKLWAADYGTPGYGSSIVPWYQTTPAHNTVVVDCTNQAATTRNGLAIWETGERFDVVQAVTDEAYPGVLHRRTIVRAGEGFVILDQLESESEHCYDWFFRSEGDFRMECAFPGGRPDECQYENIEIETSCHTQPAWRAYWRQGEDILTLVMLEGGCRVFTALSPAETAARKVHAVIARKRSASARFLVILTPGSEADTPRAAVEQGQLVVSLAGEERRVIIE